MYQVSLINNGQETVIHTPNPSSQAPHLVDMKLKKIENQSSIFTFKIYYGNIGYENLIDLVTKVKIVDTSNNKIKFEGRILLSVPQMDSSGKFFKEVYCESELGYLNDSRVGRWELHPSDLPEDAPIYAEPNYTVKKALQKIIDNHNANVNSEKHFTLGIISDNVAEKGVYFATNYESSLEILFIKIINDNGLILSIRKENNIRYLDVLEDDPAVSSTIIALRKNLKEFKQTPDYTTFCTRLIAIGADGLTFEDINNGKFYIEDTAAIAKWGIITKPYEWKDVTIKENLLQKAQAKLTEILNDSYVSVEVSALDLSFIGLTPEEFEVSTKYLVENDVQNYSNTLKVIEINLDLSEPWNSSLTFSNKTVTATSNSVGIQQQVNSNRLEVLTYNGRLIQKVSNIDGDFSTYREQTDKAILERVTNLDYESYKTQTAELISTKVTSDGVSTIIEQSATEVQTAFNGATGKFIVKNGNLELQNSNGNNVMWVDTNGLLSTDRLHVYGADNNVLIDGTGHKGVDLNSTDGGDCYIQFNNGSYWARVQSTSSAPNTLVMRGSGGVQVEAGMYLNNYVECHGVNGHTQLPLELNRLAGNGQTVVCDGTGSGTGGGLQAGDLYLLNGANIGSLSVRGSKNCLQQTEHYGERLINAYETTEYYFGDIGGGKINENGDCIVYLDEIFKECVNTKIQYHVFTQLYSGNITKIDRHQEYFIVYGEPNTEFSFEIKAKRINYETHRLDVINLVDDVTEIKVATMDLLANNNTSVDTQRILDDTLTNDLTNILLGA